MLRERGQDISANKQTNSRDNASHIKQRYILSCLIFIRLLLPCRPRLSPLTGCDPPRFWAKLFHATLHQIYFTWKGREWNLGVCMPNLFLFPKWNYGCLHSSVFVGISESWTGTFGQCSVPTTSTGVYKNCSGHCV